MTPKKSPTFQTLTGIYEPSAIQQIADGRFLVVEDEKQYPFSLVTITPAGSVSSTPLSRGPQEVDEAFWKLMILKYRPRPIRVYLRHHIALARR